MKHHTLPACVSGALWITYSGRSMVIAKLNGLRIGTASGISRLAFLFLILLLPSCARPPLRWLSDPGDYAWSGLRAEVEPWEDGARTLSMKDSFEWWYLDAQLEDGTTLVLWMGHDWPPATKGWHVSLEITAPGVAPFKRLLPIKGPISVGSERAQVQLGPHSFVGDLNSYRIVVDPDSMGGAGVDLTLTRRVPSYRPGTGYFGTRQDYFAWLAAVPEGLITGTVTLAGTQRTVRGSGYHDHNWGSVSPGQLLSKWWWGRGQAGDYTIIMASLHPQSRYGGGTFPLMLVTSPKGVVSSLYGSDVLCVKEDALVPHPDPKHADPIAGGLTLQGLTQPVRAHFTMSGKLLTSIDVQTLFSPWERILSQLAQIAPWYTRVHTDVSLNLGQEVSTGRGVLEHMEWE